MDPRLVATSRGNTNRHPFVESTDRRHGARPQNPVAPLASRLLHVGVANDQQRDPARAEAAQSDESPKERVDRELGELLEEIRVVLPGVEILFGFLIVLPFSEGFGDIDGNERIVYLVSLLCVSAGLALLMAPTPYHRIRFREGDKPALLLIANRLVLGAAALVAVGIALSLYLAVETVVGSTAAGVIASCNALWFGWFWFGLPLLRRQQDE